MKLNKLFCASLLSVSLLASMSANAAEGKMDGSKGAVWGMGGCGFASLFIKNKERLPQVAASLINGIFSNMTNSFAISSGTSNCVANRSEMAYTTAPKAFITVNLASLSKEAAEGTGEHIAALADVFGCPKAEFAKLSQSHYKNIYEVNEPDVVFQNYVNEVNLDASLSKSCLRVI